MNAKPTPGHVTLDVATEADLPRFRKDLQEAFAVAVVETFGSVDDGPIPSDDDVTASFAAPNAVVHRILEDGRWVGGAVVSAPELGQQGPGCTGVWTVARVEVIEAQRSDQDRQRFDAVGPEDTFFDETMPKRGPAGQAFRLVAQRWREAISGLMRSGQPP